MVNVTAQVKMKAVVVSRLLLGDIKAWKEFESEREFAGKIANRHTARSVSSQIGRSYRDLSIETEKFIESNFSRCDYTELARLCDAVVSGSGLNLRLGEFEQAFFPLADRVKRRFPFYAHVDISIYGLQFEFPERHFLSDLSAAFEDLKETRARIRSLGITDANLKSKRDDIAALLARDKFVSRSMISTSFSLIEAFLSGLFFTALSLNALGRLPCDGDFLSYARKKETAALGDRLDRVLKFVSSDTEDVSSDPFKSLMEVGKRYRDAIHHTTPFERRGMEAGQRLVALYEIRSELAFLCALLALSSVLRISRWIAGDGDLGEIADSCKKLQEDILVYSVEEGLAVPG